MYTNNKRVKKVVKKITISRLRDFIENVIGNFYVLCTNSGGHMGGGAREPLLLNILEDN